MGRKVVAAGSETFSTSQSIIYSTRSSGSQELPVAFSAFANTSFVGTSSWKTGSLVMSL